MSNPHNVKIRGLKTTRVPIAQQSGQPNSNPIPIRSSSSTAHSSHVHDNVSQRRSTSRLSSIDNDVDDQDAFMRLPNFSKNASSRKDSTSSSTSKKPRLMSSDESRHNSTSSTPSKIRVNNENRHQDCQDKHNNSKHLDSTFTLKPPISTNPGRISSYFGVLPLGSTSHDTHVEVPDATDYHFQYRTSLYPSSAFESFDFSNDLGPKPFSDGVVKFRDHGVEENDGNFDGNAKGGHTKKEMVDAAMDAMSNSSLVMRLAFDSVENSKNLSRVRWNLRKFIAGIEPCPYDTDLFAPEKPSRSFKPKSGKETVTSNKARNPVRAGTVR
ncbi:hypothetical protein HDU76_006665 [Blyttiomyces sp. JEL0837]|nr:hypothetical protein HDU76_006665 [Blyttiomyces sp. JEL0837]